MRRNGVVTSAAGLVPFAHLAWGYRGRDEFGARVSEYFADGLQTNQRMEYVGDGSREALCAELADIGLSEGVKSGRIRATPAEDAYEFRPGSDVVDAAATIVEWVAATEQAIVDGYSGLRTVIDAIAVTRTPEQRNAWASFEFLIDQEMAVLPSSAMCAYDLASLGAVAKELMCLHPFVAKDAVDFRLFAEPGVGFALEGEIDAGNHGIFATTLERIWQLVEGDPIVIDARGLDFVTHHQLRMLDEYARAEQRDVVLRTDQRIVARLIELLELTNVRVEAVLPVGRRDTAAVADSRPHPMGT